MNTIKTSVGTHPSGTALLTIHTRGSAQTFEIELECLRTLITQLLQVLAELETTPSAAESEEP